MDILSRKKLTFRRDSSSAFFFLISLVFLFSLYSLFFSTLLLSSSHFTLLLSLYNKLFSDISVFPLYFHLLYFSLFFFFIYYPLFFIYYSPAVFIPLLSLSSFFHLSISLSYIISLFFLVSIFPLFPILSLSLSPHSLSLLITFPPFSVLHNLYQIYFCQFLSVLSICYSLMNCYSGGRLYKLLLLPTAVPTYISTFYFCIWMSIKRDYSFLFHSPIMFPAACYFI